MMKYTMAKSGVRNQSWPYLWALQICLALALINKNMTAVCANDATPPEIPASSDNENDSDIVPNDGALKEKRNWQSLQGSWGKRAPNDNDFNAEEKRNWQSLQGSWGKRAPSDSDMNAEEKRNWQSLQGSWGKRGDWSALHGSWGKRVRNDMDFNVEDKRADNGNKRPNWGALHGAWGKRGDQSDNMFNEEEKRNWQSLQGAWGKRSAIDNDSNEDLMDNEQILPVLVTSKLAFLSNPNALEQLSSVDYNEDDDIFNEKRSWNKMHGAWGKRNKAGPLSNRGSWGKRENEQNWNKFRGVWGKRSPSASRNGWLKFNKSWGKRSQKYADTN